VVSWFQSLLSNGSTCTAYSAAVRAQAAAGAGRAVQGWVKHFPPTWAVKAGLVRRRIVPGTGGGSGGVAGGGAEGEDGDAAGDGGGGAAGGGGESYEGEAAAAVLLLSARDLLRGHGGGRNQPMTEAAAAAAAERAAEAARLATLAGKLHRGGAQPHLVRGLAHLQVGLHSLPVVRLITRSILAVIN
jgi:hypothetical protein